MENFKKTLQMRMRLLAVYNFFLLMLIVIGVFHPTAGTTQHVTDFMSGANVGLYAAIQAGLIAAVTKYGAALKDEGKRKALYIEENDERRKYIFTQMGGMAINICLGGLMLATVTAGFYNQTVYFTLLGVLGFCALVKGGLKLYYNKNV